MSSIIGRGPELRELDEAFARAVTERQPQIVTVLGSPGVGKTRLVSEFLHRLENRERRARTFRGVCHENAPAFGVIQRVLRTRFEIGEADDDTTAKETLQTKVAEVLGEEQSAEFLHFLGAYLDLDFADSPFTKAVEGDPTQFARVSRAVLRRWLEVDAQSSPLVVVFEDLHWAQDDFLELIHYLADSLRDAPILLVCAGRPDLLARHATWLKAGGTRHRKTEVGPLGADDAASLMMNLLEPLLDPPNELVDAAVAVAGGTPYLLEQMVGAYVQAGVLVDEDGTRTVNLENLDQAQLPLTVDDAISARISSVTPAERELLEKASAMGGVFWRGALIALSRIGADTPDLWGGHESLVAYFDELLAGLAGRDYVLKMPDSSIAGEVEYAFKHNLEREALSRLTHRQQQRRFHRVVAEWLEFRLHSRGEEQLELLASHFEEGGLPRRAALHYLEAGDKARARYANRKSAEFYSRGLELLGDDDIPRRVDALHCHGDVLQLAGENDLALSAFREMLELAYRLDLKAKGGVAHNRIGRVFRSIGRLDEAMRHLGTGQALFVAAGDERGVASSIDDIGKVHWMRGNYEAAESFMVKALEMRRSLRDARSIALSQNNLGLVFQDSGRFAEAKQAFQEAWVLRQEIGDRPGIAQTLNNLGTIHQDDGDHDRSVELFQDALAIAKSVGDRMREAIILTNLGESQYRMEQPSEAIETLQRAEEVSRALGDRILEGEILRGLSKAHMLVHDHAAAEDYIGRSIELFEAARGKPFLGTALRTLGEIAAAAGWGGEAHERAKSAFVKSIALFEELGNEIELARSLVSYAGFLEAGGEEGPDPMRAHEAMQLRSKADEIRSRLRESESYALQPLDGESTQPGTLPPTE